MNTNKLIASVSCHDFSMCYQVQKTETKGSF